jgi:hypothetical protein
VPPHQLPHSLGGVADVEQLADQRLDPAQRPPLIGGEPMRQRPLPQLGLQPGPLPRAEPLPRHRPPRPQRLNTAIPPGPVPPPHRPLGDPQVAGDLPDRVAAREPPGGLQPQPLTPLLLGGRIPTPLRIPHTPVIRPGQPTSRPDLYEFSLCSASGHHRADAHRGVWRRAVITAATAPGERRGRQDRTQRRGGPGGPPLQSSPTTGR